MKKVFLYLLLLVSMLSFVSAYEVLDGSDQAQQYFPLNSDDVKIKSDDNVSVLTLKYDVNGLRTSMHPFSDCGSSKCVELDLSDIVDSNGDSLNDSIEFTIDVNSSETKIYLDVKNPQINVTYAVDNSNKKINFEISEFDDVGIENVTLYERVSSSNNFISDITGDDSYSFTYSKQNHEFVFKILDKAGNKEEKTVNVNVGDITKPVINTAYVTKQKDGSFELTLKLSDDTKIDRYEVKQGSLDLNEDVNSASYSNTIKIPFEDDIITIFVYDNKENFVSKSLDLDTKIINSYPSKYSDSKTFEFTSNADECKLEELNDDDENDEFDKNNDRFSLKLDVDPNENNDVEFYCEKDGFRENFEREFFYDDENPTENEISIEKQDDGSLKLIWTQSTDTVSDVTYELYRNDEKIYSGTKLEYTDKKVLYPNRYVYYVKVLDEARNYVDSNQVSEVPQKVSVYFDIDSTFDNTKVNDNKFKLAFDTEQGVSAKLIMKNDDKVIAEQSFTTISDKVSLDLELLKGKNLIILELEDELGNKINKEYSIIYEEKILVKPTEEVKDSLRDDIQLKPQDSVIEPAVVENATANKNSDDQKQEGISIVSSWFWFALILIALGYFIWYFVINEDALRLKDRYNGYKNRNHLNSSKKKKSNGFEFFAPKRDKDKVLAKDFNRIKQNRIVKQREQLEDEIKKKRLEQRENQRSELDKKKFADLSASKREVDIPFNQRLKAKRRVDKIKREVDYEHELSSMSKKEPQQKKGFGFFNKEPPKELSEMDMYLQKTTHKKGWSTSRDYVQTPEPPVESKKESQQKGADKKSFLSKFQKQNKEEVVKSHVDVEELKQKDIVEKQDDSIVNEEKSSKKSKLGLDDYLSNIDKKKKRKKFYMAEKFVNSDIRNRRN